VFKKKYLKRLTKKSCFYVSIINRLVFNISFSNISAISWGDERWNLV